MAVVLTIQSYNWCEYILVRAALVAAFCSIAMGYKI